MKDILVVYVFVKSRKSMSCQEKLRSGLPVTYTGSVYCTTLGSAHYNHYVSPSVRPLAVSENAHIS